MKLNDIDEVRVDENAETVDLVVTTSRRFCEDQSFRYTTSDGTALAGYDYNAYAAAVAILPAETTEFTLSLPTILINDPIDEADTETFEVEVRWGATKEEVPAGNRELPGRQPPTPPSPPSRSATTTPRPSSSSPPPGPTRATM